MGYTPLPDHIFHTSPVKQVVATVLIAIFLGIGGAYAIYRTAPVKTQAPTVITPISPSNIPTALPTEEIIPTTEQSSQQRAGMCSTDADCGGGCNRCQNNFCTSTSCHYEPVQTSSSCPSGTVKVCQAGECECLPQ